MLFRAATVLALSLACLFVTQPSAHANVDDFSIESWHVSYEIGTDKKGRAFAEVTETVKPVFPDFDQNRGMVRGIALESFGASTAPSHVSVTDENGVDVPFSVEEDDTYAVILVGDDSYVRGKQTYVISYYMRDVIAPIEPEDEGGTGLNEFYWDLVPLERNQAISSFSAEITFLDDLASELTGDMACYRGVFESGESCEITAEGATVTIASMSLERREGVTVAIGLNTDSVVQPPARTPSLMSDVLPFFVSGAGVAIAGIAGIFVARHKNKSKHSRGLIIAQYDVPEYLPPLIASPIIGKTKDPVAAELVHLSVRGATQMYDGQGNRPIFARVDASLATDPLDKQTLQAMNFDQAENFQIPKSDTTFSSRMTKLRAAGTQAAHDRGYLTKETHSTARLLGFIALGLLVVGFLAAFSGIMVSRDSAQGAFITSIVMGVVGLLFVKQSIFKTSVHTPLGAETREYLLGVKEFISVAEADRLQMLQSYTGAERSSVSDRDGDALPTIEIYEHLLPYAILFGLERQWAKVLQIKYEETNHTPHWYPGYAFIGMNTLQQNMGNFTQSISSAASYTSSSSGGSTGGGFSGGGGGGGFSGGR